MHFFIPFVKMFHCNSRAHLDHVQALRTALRTTMHAFQWKHTIFGYLPNRNPSTIYMKFCVIHYVDEIT
jgi:hypothetical protein